ncbi:LINE-1 reverse transcriptase-like protein, partial [Bienertia sinuspersici]
SDLPWLVGGDLNEVFYNFEKKGGGTKNQSVLESFREACQGCDLWDVNYSSYPYTWWNGREGDDAVEERLDRFLASSSWSVLFPWAKVEHIDFDFSDHLPIRIKLVNNHGETKRSRRGFRLKNMWVQEEGCGDIVREAWDDNTVVDPIQALKMKHTKCAEKLRRWNGETFGNSWSHLCERKAEGGLGFRDMKAFSDAMLAK